jgi:hypothetical protein
MNKSGFTVMTGEINTDRHKFGLADFDNNAFKADKRLNHVSLDLLNFDFRVILDDEFNFFFFFLFDLNQVIVPNQTETLDDFISFRRKAGKNLFKHFRDVVAIDLFKFLSKFGKAQYDIIVKLVQLFNMKDRSEKSLFHGMGKKKEDFMRREIELN